MIVDLCRAKQGFAVLFPVGHPALEAILAQPDAIAEEEFTQLFPVLIRLAGIEVARS